MKKMLVANPFALAALGAMACGAADSQPEGGGPAPSRSTIRREPPAASDVGSDRADGQPVACVAKGDEGNALGVGAFCDKTTTRCKTGQLCTADFDAPAGAHFCTILCATDADCGSGAVCYARDSRGKGCVPNACVKK